MRHLALIGAAAMLVGCGSIQVPVTGVTGDGEPMQGQAEASFFGGSFWVAAAGGFRCDGAYDSLDTNPTIIAPVKCNDGRTGTAVITRQLDRRSGTVVAQLNDGSTAQFAFGDLSFEQAFGSATARTAPTPRY